MQQHNPMHPGKFILNTYLSPFGLSRSKLAKHLNVSPSSVSRLVRGDSHVSAEMALRLSAVLGRSPESWLAMQGNFDLWQARQKIDLNNYESMNFKGGRFERRD